MVLSVRILFTIRISQPERAAELFDVFRLTREERPLRSVALRILLEYRWCIFFRIQGDRIDDNLTAEAFAQTFQTLLNLPEVLNPLRSEI